MAYSSFDFLPVSAADNVVPSFFGVNLKPIVSGDSPVMENFELIVNYNNMIQMLWIHRNRLSHYLLLKFSRFNLLISSLNSATFLGFSKKLEKSPCAF